MTKSQQVKKALKGHFYNLRCSGGRGTACGWVELSFDYPRPTGCRCSLQAGGYCRECSNKRNELEQKVYDLINQSKVELYSYYVDDGYNTKNACMLIDINFV